MDHLSSLLLVTTSFLSVAVAFQTVPSGLIGVAPSTSSLWMDAASTPPSRHQLQPFVVPLLQDVDWIQGFRERVSQHHSAPADNDDEDDILLDYLPWFVLQQTPKPKQLIAQATRQYVYGDTRRDPKVNVTELLQIVDEEYKCTDVPVQIGDTTLSVEHDRTHLSVVRILSFAAYHRLPQEITALLFGDDEDLRAYKEAFLKDGWNSVSFPRGLSIRLPRNRLTSKLDRYQPIPRRFLLAQNAKSANRAVQEAARIKAPVQRRLSKEAFLSTLQKEMTSRNKVQRRVLPHFRTTKRNLAKYLRRRVRRAALFLRHTLRRLKQSIRATVLSYGLLAFLWYNLSMVWQWQSLSATALISVSTSAMHASLHRIGGVMAQTYATTHIFVLYKLPVLLVALSVAPLAHRLLVYAKTQLGVATEDRALLLVGTTLAASHLFLGAGIFFLDAAILRSIVL